jgi:hypothetical protein
MKTTLRTDITVKDICDGFVYNQLEGKGLFGLSGKFKSINILSMLLNRASIISNGFCIFFIFKLLYFESVN